MNFICDLTIVISRLPCLFNKANAVSSTVGLVNSEPSDSISSFNFAMWAFARKCIPMELVPCSDGWQSTWWETIHMMARRPVFSIPQCKVKCCEDECLELFLAIGRFEPIFIVAHQVLNMICNIRSVKSQIQICPFLDDIVTSSNEVFIVWEHVMVIGSWRLCNSCWETVKGDIIVE